MYDSALDPQSCRNCINWRGEKGCNGAIYRYCRGGNPKVKRFFNVDVRIGWHAKEERVEEVVWLETRI